MKVLLSALIILFVVGVDAMNNGEDLKGAKPVTVTRPTKDPRRSSRDDPSIAAASTGSVPITPVAPVSSDAAGAKHSTNLRGAGAEVEAIDEAKESHGTVATRVVDSETQATPGADPTQRFDGVNNSLDSKGR